MCSLWHFCCGIALGERSAWLGSNRLSIQFIDHWDESLMDVSLSAVGVSWEKICRDRDRQPVWWQRQAAGAQLMRVDMEPVCVCPEYRWKGGSHCLEGGHMLLEIAYMLLWCGCACMCSGRRIWCSANPLCNGAANPPPSLSSSPSPFLHAEVYVKALRKTITLTSTSPPDQS